MLCTFKPDAGRAGDLVRRYTAIGVPGPFGPGAQVPVTTRGVGAWSSLDAVGVASAITLPPRFVVNDIIAAEGQSVERVSPWLDAALPDGSNVQVCASHWGAFRFGVVCEVARDAAFQWPDMKRPKGPRAVSDKPSARSRIRGQDGAEPLALPEGFAPLPGGVVPVATDGVSVDSSKVSSAFDLWLERGLHKLFDDVAREPVPPELLKLIEGDRQKAEDDKAK